MLQFDFDLVDILSIWFFPRSISKLDVIERFQVKESKHDNEFKVKLSIGLTLKIWSSGIVYYFYRRVWAQKRYTSHYHISSVQKGDYAESIAIHLKLTFLDFNSLGTYLLSKYSITLFNFLNQKFSIQESVKNILTANSSAQWHIF
jgi:hypothetical protein